MTETEISHEQEVIELFDKVTAELPGKNQFRVITLDGFKIAIEQMMNKAFYHGQMNAIEATQSAFEEVFRR